MVLINGMDFELRRPPNYVLLPNGDPRFTYAREVIAGISAGDLANLKELLHKFCTPDVLMSFHYDDDQPNPYGPKKAQISGLIITYCYI